MIRHFKLLMVAISILAMPASAAERVADTQGQTRGLYLQLIQQARADGRPRAAIAYLDDFERKYPGDLDASILRANAMLDLGQIDEAAAVLATLTKSQNSVGLSAVRGHVLAARGQWAEAIPFYQAAAAAGPTDPMLRNALGYALLRGGYVDRAIEQLRNAADLAPDDNVIRNNLILACTMAGRRADADAIIARAGDRQSQADLRRQVAAEVARIAKLVLDPSVSAKKAG
ncbi:MAG: Tetratricopeptide 4 [Rhizorhabdus sp.]|nr:Tetratricopeptide 4 [Rhizorhabdus sp.]